MRIVQDTRQYDYRSIQEFLKHKGEMLNRGWTCEKDYPLDDEYLYKHTAIYRTGILYNGVNGK